MASFQTGYTPVGAGVAYAQLTMGDEDALFFEADKGADIPTQWKQEWFKYTPHHSANIFHQFTSAGCGRKNSTDMIRSPDMWFWTYVLGYFPAIAPNSAEGAEDCSYVNAPIVYVQKEFEVKIGSQPVFKIDALALLILCELYGLLDLYSELIGFCKTRNQLKLDAKRSRILGAPLVGLPFHMGPDTAFNIGSITFHTVKSELNARPITEMILNYGNIAAGKIPLPKVVSTNLSIENSSVDLGLAATMVWLSKAERATLVDTYNERLFRETLLVGEGSIPVSTKAHRVAFDIDMKGPTTQLMVVIQSDTDYSSHNWTKFCADDGSDYISEMMLITGTTPREDGLPANFYRTAKVIEVWKTIPQFFVYLLSFETDARSKQMTGHQNMTNAEKLKFSALYNAHADTLHVFCYQTVYNGWYTEKGTGGRVWG